MSHDSSPRPDIRPWYREVWPWVIFGLPLLAVVAGIVTAVLAVTHADPVVVEDWYKEGRAYNRHLGMDRQAAQFGLGARFLAEGDAVHLHLHSRVKLPWPETLTLHLRHPTLAERDREIALHRQPDGSYLAPSSALPEGEWHVTLSGENWRLVERLHINSGEAVKLGVWEQQ